MGGQRNERMYIDINKAVLMRVLEQPLIWVEMATNYFKNVFK